MFRFVRTGFLGLNLARLNGICCVPVQLGSKYLSHLGTRIGSDSIVSDGVKEVSWSKNWPKIGYIKFNPSLVFGRGPSRYPMTLLT